jgi:hypothetical protein
VRPQALATLTTRHVWPLNWSNDTDSPVIDVISSSWKVDIAPTIATMMERWTTT